MTQCYKVIEHGNDLRDSKIVAYIQADTTEQAYAIVTHYYGAVLLEECSVSEYDRNRRLARVRWNRS